jgi:putative ABC transport system permease protein
VSIDTGPVLERTRQEFLQGSREEMRQGMVQDGKCVVSDNFARLHDVGIGDVVELAAPTGPLRLPIVAITTSFVSDRGVIFVDRGLFVKHWQDDGVDGFHVVLHPGSDVLRVRDALVARLAPHAAVLVSTRQEFVAQVNSALAGFYALTRLTISMALVVAFVGIATSLLISVVERSREIGIMKALGAARAQIGGAVVLEALAVAACGLALAVPLGILLARFLETTVAESYSGFNMPHAYPLRLLGEILIGLPVLASLAAWLPARQAIALRATETISYE